MTKVREVNGGRERGEERGTHGGYREGRWREIIRATVR